jgi:hypothetical protein
MYIKCGCVREAREKFCCKHQGITVPKRKSIHVMISKLSVWI